MFSVGGVGWVVFNWIKERRGWVVVVDDNGALEWYYIIEELGGGEGKQWDDIEKKVYN